MRRKDKEIGSREEMDQIVRGSQVCRIAVSMENMPYIVPLSFGYDGQSIFIHTAKEGKKVLYFENNNNVCFEFERSVKVFSNPDTACGWSFSYESVIGYGKIFEIESFKDKEMGINRIMSQYSGKEWVIGKENMEKVRVWRIAIDSMTGKRSRKSAT